jgi:hypothetical protein
VCFFSWLGVCVAVADPCLVSQVPTKLF